MLVFEERGKPEYPEKNLSERRREPTTNLTRILDRKRHQSPNKNYFFCNLTVMSSKKMTDFVLPVCLYCILLLFVIVVFK